MPLSLPTLDDRRYQDLLDESLARIPVHNPEWTNFNKSDPGVTLIEVFAFLTENLLYRANQIPERNRRKFLSLLGVPLQPASSAQGIVAFTNESQPPATVTLTDGLQVDAGSVPFRTVQGLDVLPIEAQVYFKREVKSPSENLKAYYQQLYASHMGEPPTAEPQLYETVPLSALGSAGIDLGQHTTDGSLWIALLLRASDKARDEVREKLFGKTLSLGIVPYPDDSGQQLRPGGQIPAEDQGLLEFRLPKGGLLERDERGTPQPRYMSLDAKSTADVLAVPGIVQITLPTEPPNSTESDKVLTRWDNLDPLEAGVGDLPPALDDTNLDNRLITWLRVSPRASVQQLAAAKVQIRLLWVGINAALVTQRAHIADELLPDGTGEPDQVVVLSKTPVVPKSVQLTVTTDSSSELWQAIDDLMSADPEVPTPNLRQPPGAPKPEGKSAKVFVVDPESGEIRFGDGLHGARPPFGARLRVSYDYAVGAAGNVGPGSINTVPGLPAVKVSNPVRTWGGAEAETVSAAEKQIARYLQHRDRLVNVADFETITLRTPGLDIGRVEVLPAFSPELPSNEPGDAAGAVTLLIIPGYDPDHPDAPQPDRLFLQTICDYLDSRRLVTTEVFLRGPVYKPIWVSIGIDVLAGVSIATVREAVKQRLSAYLSPLPPSRAGLLDSQAALLTTPQYAAAQKGWPLRKPIVALELLAEANRVPGVRFVNGVQLAEVAGGTKDRVDMAGLNLPRLVQLSVSVGDPIAVEELRGAARPAGPGPTFVPVPVIPEEC